MNEANKLITAFGLTPHPEGGFYKETYRSPLTLNVASPFSGPRAASTAIYYLLTGGAKSAFHRIRSDEVWHFYEGGPLKIIDVDPESGQVCETILGPPAQGGIYQHVVPAGRWFGSIPMPGVAYSFVGCTVAPGFDFADFELAETDAFLKHYPQAIPYRFLLP